MIGSKLDQQALGFSLAIFGVAVLWMAKSRTGESMGLDLLTVGVLLFLELFYAWF